MSPSEEIGNQIVYLDYVLEGSAGPLDAELLRPVWDNLHRLAIDPDIPRNVKASVRDAESWVFQWMEMGTSVSRETMEWVRQRLTRVLGMLTPSPRVWGAFTPSD
ncbi:MAG: hypothetical protein C7B45_09680 [Sulfobacillus acidophilus]|uniref:Uncharacterized protein n=1 Tax=Sulfobacillus acidophilus TaxID=53633 RepID=A0A2T2WHL8_9FIRM|nr:MAG: hypothetical protein C7B45_09680 [Sulfobacillus acidophilus]